MHSYLTGRYQRVKINNSQSLWSLIKHGAPQGKIQCDLETKLQKASVKLFKLFYENDMKVKQDKCHFLSSLDISAQFSLPACILENSDHKNDF